MRKYIMFIAMLIFPVMLMAQDATAPDSLQSLLSMLAPLIVYAATWVVGRINVNIPAWAVIAVVVPVLSVAATYLVGLVGDGSGSGMAWWQQFVYNLAAVFTHEILKKLPKPTPTP